jgi:hypothetical protein
MQLRHYQEIGAVFLSQRDEPKSHRWGITEIGRLGRETGVEGLGRCENLKFEI